ncbi:MAG: hypothetical protein JL50_05270 [Peptococcaceae bacterium BICA1-7]|nr:MAG: hypothetical protein JL50_05270 [Peptococcaceae bacterium BICA1-7]HBV96026.1 hypothetical protein [Desulfotomaculum sp.]
MNIPFTTGQFLAIFQSYNQAIWPMQVTAYILGMAAIYLAVRKSRNSDKIICGILAIMWIWTGAAYHISFFSSINKAAYAFGALFIMQGLLFTIYGVIKSGISFKVAPSGIAAAGCILTVYSMVVYPVIGQLLGHGYPQSPVFGVTPCPVTIFTFGLLLWAEKMPRRILLIPLFWSLIGSFAAFSLGIREDIGLLAAGMAGTLLILIKNRQFLIRKHA